MTEPLHPDITVKLVGEDGNAVFIVGRVASALRRARVPQHEIDLFTADAFKSDYDHLLATCIKWVNVT